MKRKNSIFLKTSLLAAIQSYFQDESGEVGFMGGGGGDPEPGGGDPEPGGGDPEPGNYQYPDGFDEKLKGDKGLLKFAGEDGKFNYGAIMKSYVHSQGMLGKDKMALPDDTWTDDQYKDLYTKLGRPEDIKEYNVENNLAEGIEKNEEFFNGLKEAAYKSGLSTKQAQGMSDFFNTFLGESTTKNSQISQDAYEAESNSLKAEWGDKYDYKAKRAFSALGQFASKEEITEMSKKGLLESSLITKVFDKIANGMAEDTLKVDGGSTFGMTGEEAAAEIQSYYTPGHPFMTRGHPEHNHYKNKMLKLQGIKLASRRKG